MWRPFQIILWQVGGQREADPSCVTLGRLVNFTGGLGVLICERGPSSSSFRTVAERHTRGNPLQTVKSHPETRGGNAAEHPSHGASKTPALV